MEASSPEASQSAPAMVRPENASCKMTKIGRTFFAAEVEGTEAAAVAFDSMVFLRTEAEGMYGTPLSSAATLKTDPL